MFLSIVAAGLIASWLGPAARFWDNADRSIFWTCNNTLKGETAWSYFWAFVNWRGFDAIGFSTIAIFSVIWLRARGRGEMLHRIMYLLAYVGLVGLFWFATIGWEAAGPKGRVKDRPSPSRVVEADGCDYVNLTYRLGWTRAKVKSHHCFPSDHAILALSMAAFFVMEGSPILGGVSLAILGFLTLPRVFSGAHWMTDVIIGGVAIVLLICAVWMSTAGWRAKILPGIEKKLHRPLEFFSNILSVGLK